MPAHVRRLYRAVAAAGIVTLLLTGAMSFDAYGAEGKKDEKKKETVAKKSVAAKADRSGTAHVSSTKASGAGIVAKEKACFGNTPKIEKVKPDEGKAGDTVTITGESFGAAGCLTAVSFGPGNEAKFSHKSDTTVTATVPERGKKGIRLLTVTTASGEDTKPFLVK
ncbi:MAG: IPT/TIG domain-containing protein [Nitrospirota bacterium]|nr:IPT/TIG domain-containing protein [Nitrospirota bacterium]